MPILINSFRFATAGGGPALDDIPVTTNLYFWAKRGTGFYSDNGVTPATSNGDHIRRWYDPRANGLYLECGDTGNSNRHPRLDTVSKTSFSVARLETTSGNERYFVIPSLTSLSESEIYVAIKPNNYPPAAGKTGIWAIGASGQQSHYSWTDGTIYDSLCSTARRGVAPGSSLAAWRTYGGWSATNDWAMRLDGSSIGTSGSNTPGFASPAYLGVSLLVGEYFDGAIAEFAIYSAKLSGSDRTSVDAYFADICAAS